MAVTQLPTITATPQDNGVLFQFSDNQHYLGDGSITVPVNSLALITDDSDMFTFRKAVNNDILLSARYDDIGMTKSQLQQFFEDYMVKAPLDEDDVEELTSGYVTSAEYIQTSHTINFLHDQTVVSSIDASDFIKDGMVDNVVVSGTNLVITFNTDSGKEAITIPLSSFFPADQYYTKSEVDDAMHTIAASLNDLNVNKLDATAYTPTDLSNYYTKSEVDAEIANIDLSAKADVSDVNDAFEVATRALFELKNEKLDATAYTPTDLSNYYNKTEVDAALATKADASRLGGMSLVKLTQAEYDAISTPDANTLYIITNVV